MAKVLAVLSSGYKDEKNNYETGWWAEELFAPMLLLEEAGHRIDLASPLGGKPTIDKTSISKDYDPNGTYKELYESGKADKTSKLSDINPNEYDAVFIVGGHGAMFDLAKNDDLHHILRTIYLNGNIVSAVCHGPSPLVWTKLPNGESIIAGLKVTGFPNSEEPAAIVSLLPYSLEDEMSRIAQYSANEKVIWGNKQLLTGRDPFASQSFGEELVNALQNK
ncbi:type 1 glutamine amidotransferase domain-containing protein [Bacillus gaemokensis]|uniref:Thiamine biosynthesis protein ThiJ n=1 Tax=Bacillus gaemokensis TaxID=574375 RepID=A0A073KA79_9BACI|nr:type 1 glutamine amidotransferase domain-containing protein [Bacillus gaemokensis]KEK23362.1 thiamine biosynthesis protein ThiJ [Bacillus gaemokensis]KYG37853.1 thiamine biosynthesis protein ThiJ [Bacillus gaemokensis]